MENLIGVMDFAPDWGVRTGLPAADGQLTDGQFAGPAGKHLVLVAHDNKKPDLLEWATHNRNVLSEHHIYATGSTGRLIQDQLQLPVKRFLSGPLGGDQQIGAYIAQGEIDLLVFFWDPLEQQPHDPDVLQAPQRRHIAGRHGRHRRGRLGRCPHPTRSPSHDKRRRLLKNRPQVG